MMNYYGLNIPLRALLMTLLFVCANAAVVLFIRLVKRKRLYHSKVFLPIVAVICTFFCVMFATEARAVKFSRDLPEIVQKVCEMPIIVCILSLFASLCYLVFTYFSDRNFKKNNLSQASIKESLDKLPSGLCFCLENGKTVLVNNVMEDLCFKIVGRDLQNANLFWEILSGGEVLPEIERISTGEHPSFRLIDGRVWTFSRAELEGVIQLVAADTTDLSNVNAELKLKNVELASVNQRLLAYGESVDELTRTKERISIKANIHRELGQALLITRRFLADTSDDYNVPISVWKKNISMLKQEADHESDESPLNMFLQAADAAGVSFEISGKFPENHDINHLFIAAAVECLVNGVRHAGATTLYITITESNEEITVVYENNGALPVGEIIEGGGLSSLRYDSARLGGLMEVRVKPKYSLIIKIPKERSKLDVKI